MREILFRGKRVELNHGKITYGDWVYGYYYDNDCPSLLINGKHINAEYILVQDSYGDVPCLGNLGSPSFFQVLPETVGQFTGLTDKNGKKIFEGDIVKFFGMAGKVCFEQGCFGIGVQEIIDWKKIKKQILPLTGCDNKPYFCENDNFVSFWELIWNFNGEDEQCDVCEVIGNIHDNPELLEKDNA